MKKTWKAVERAVARKLGGERTSNQGLGSAVPDVVSDAYCVEVKHRERLPGWIKLMVRQARTNGQPDHLSLVVLHEKNMRHDDDIVMVRLGDFVEWFWEINLERTQDS